MSTALHCMFSKASQRIWNDAAERLRRTRLKAR